MTKRPRTMQPLQCYRANKFGPITPQEYLSILAMNGLREEIARRTVEIEYKRQHGVDLDWQYEPHPGTKHSCL